MSIFKKWTNKQLEKAEKERVKLNNIVAKEIFSRLAEFVADNDLSDDKLAKKIEDFTSEVIAIMLKNNAQYASRTDIIGMIARPIQLIHNELENRSQHTQALILSKLTGKRLEDLSFQDIDVILRDKDLVGYLNKEIGTLSFGRENIYKSGSGS